MRQHNNYKMFYVSSEFQLTFFNVIRFIFSLQCFNIVGWATGRASDL